MNDRTVHEVAARRSVGFWMAAVMALLQAIYALQAFADPVAFAAYRATPIASLDGVRWVHTYGSRTLFVALVVALLLAREELGTLRWVALVGVIMPISDALIAFQANAPGAVLLRHIGTAIYLLITFVVLTRWLRRARLRAAR
jgi:hypothetical protein